MNDAADTPERWDWAVAVFCQNEHSAIADCLMDIEAASAGRRVFVCVVVNGSTDGSEARAIEVARERRFDCVVVRVGLGDKSNAINLFNESLRVPADACIYVDGYVRIAQPSFEALVAALDAVPEARATTGVCSNGRTMQLATKTTLEVGGQLHGQLNAFRPGFLDRMVARGIRLPIGLYRGDGLLGTYAAHDLDPVHQPWENARVKGVAAAQYAIRPLSALKLRDLRRQFRRMVRQARGRLEVLATRDIIFTKGFEGMPAYADDMLRDYLAAHGAPRLPNSMMPFLWLAMRDVSRARRPSPESLKGKAVFSSRPGLLASLRSKDALLPG